MRYRCGVTRARKAQDWQRDLSAARAVERDVAQALREGRAVSSLQDHTAGYDRLDFFFTWKQAPVWLDVKEKKQPYSKGITALFPEAEPTDLFILDETVFRRIVWQGGGGYLAVRDVPGDRWVYLGPWELTLGPKKRYNRWIERRPGQAMLKGKSLLDLSVAKVTSRTFSVEALGSVIDSARKAKDQLAAVRLAGRDLPELGDRPNGSG